MVDLMVVFRFTVSGRTATDGAGRGSAHLIAITLAGRLPNGEAAPPVRGYVFVGPSARILPVITDPGRPYARSEITLSGSTTYARETPDEIATAPCVERQSK